uniref:Uncharacterized protein n=1 Tax=Glossina palpalis gambiensis TaxID=67801 RepID=A0A1B0BQ66_9MUSC
MIKPENPACPYALRSVSSTLTQHLLPQPLHYKIENFFRKFLDYQTPSHTQKLLYLTVVCSKGHQNCTYTSTAVIIAPLVAAVVAAAAAAAFVTDDDGVGIQLINPKCHFAICGITLYLYVFSGYIHTSKGVIKA